MLRPRTVAFFASALALLATRPGQADELPFIEHQPGACTVHGEPFRLCAKVSDDVGVGKARVYFRRSGDKYYSFVDMAFDGLNYCATLPAPRDGKTHLVEYYVQALDSAYQAKRTSTFQLQTRPTAECEFAPVERDPARRRDIVVHASDRKQGKKLPDGFVGDGVSFVPVPSR